MLGTGFDERCELLETIVAGVEVGTLLQYQTAHLGERHPVVVVGQVVDGASQQFDERSVDLLFRSRLPGGRRRLATLHLGSGLGIGIALAIVIAQVLDIDELVARHDKRTRGLTLTHADDQLARLAQTGGQTGEVAVARNEAEAVHLVRVQNIHRVDDHRRVGGVLARGIAVLLDGRDGVFEQHPLPPSHGGLGPVAVDALDGGYTVFSDFVEHFLHMRVRHIVGVKQHGQVQVFLIVVHILILFKMK